MEHTDIKTLDGYFKYIFAQSGYYFRKTLNLKEWFTNFEDFRNKYSLNNLYMEMECDNGVKSSEELRTRACKYVQYAKNFPHRAYYFDADVENLRLVKEQCPDYI
ncbi:DUF4855 domain-containing protein [Thermococcus sp. 21S7]|uniref:DUF4855 domain-containing protein n=1 Tax=Thermococcus sp. 21S7 TaxID=1638221 RepID=UPI0014391762|nr:DUF4855 domain-containing protein [Thermococcus sp. 21S7]NJE61734.1 DUF4855 domain-containing protein [Thermococcus sp. 21S7]